MSYVLRRHMLQLGKLIFASAQPAGKNIISPYQGPESKRQGCYLVFYNITVATIDTIDLSCARE